MSRASTGITYGVTLDGSGVASGVAASEATLTAHVARMNALRIEIPAGLELTQFNAQAAVINQQLAQWQQGINIPVNIGGGISLALPGGGGGNTLNATQNNIDLSQTTNNLTSLQAAFTEVNNTTNNVTNVINQAAASAQGTANALGGLHSRMRLIHAAVQGLGLIEAGFEYHGNLQAHQDDIAAQVKDDETWGQHVEQAGNAFFGAGRLGRTVQRLAIRGTNALGLSNDATPEEIEQTKEDTKKQEKRIEEYRKRVDAQKRVSEELSRFDDEAARAAEAGATRADQQAARVAAAGRRITDLDRWWSTLTVDEQHAPENVRKYQQARQGFAAAQGNVQSEILQENLQSESQREFTRDELAAYNAGDTQGARRIRFDARIAREREQARKEGPQALRQFDEQIAPQERQKEEDEVRRDRERKESESQDRITEARARGEQARLKLSGDTERAAVQAFDQSQAMRLRKLDEAIAAEADGEQKRRLIAERQAERDAQGAQRAEFLAEQRRRLAGEQVASDLRVASSRAAAAADDARGADQTYRAGEIQFQAGWDQRLGQATRARDAEAPGSPARRQREAELAALQGEYLSAAQARQAGRSRETANLSFENDQRGLRLGGYEGTADINEIRHRSDEAFRQAEGDPARQAEVRRGEGLELQQFLRQYETRAERTTAESVGRASRTDLLGTYSGSRDVGKETLDTLRGEIKGVLDTIAANTKNNVARVGP